MKVATTTEGTTLHPYKFTDTPSGAYIDLMFLLPLLRYDKDTLELKPYAAASVQKSADNTTLTFALRDNLPFSDGKPITASDYAWTWSKASDKANGWPNLGSYTPYIASAGSFSAVDRAQAAGTASLSYWHRAYRHVRRDRVTIFACALLLLITLLSLAAPMFGHLLNKDPATQDLLSRLEKPSHAHWLGTDELGRDILIRLLYAGRISLLIGVLAMLTSLVIGVSLGVLGGFFRRWVDDAINGLIQTTINIPLLFLLILLSVIFSPGVVGLALILGLFSWQGTARQVRAIVLSVSQRDYIDAARVLGSSNGRLMFRHIFPNVISTVLVVAGFDIAGAILAESGLSALGFGVQPPTASWGNMLSKSFQYALKAPWLVVSPGVMIFLTVLSVFLIADGLRDALDPRIS